MKGAMAQSFLWMGLGGASWLWSATSPHAGKPVKTLPPPQPACWQLDLPTPLGGWTSAKQLLFAAKVKDPTLPEAEGVVSAVEENAEMEEELDDESFYVRKKKLVKEHPHAVQLQCWINGMPSHQKGMLNQPLHVLGEVQDGENRIELREPVTGQRAVRSFWANNTRDRLTIRLSEVQPYLSQYHGGWLGGLQVVEPDSTESIGGEPTPSGGKNTGSAYRHTSPLPGTYTVRWYDTRYGVDGYTYNEGNDGDDDYSSRQDRPHQIVCDVVLDSGTDRERRWRFERLMMPGSKRVTLGSFDVED